MRDLRRDVMEVQRRYETDYALGNLSGDGGCLDSGPHQFSEFRRGAGKSVSQRPPVCL